MSALCSSQFPHFHIGYSAKFYLLIQVYIVARQQEVERRNQQAVSRGEEEEEDTEDTADYSGGESLLSLVQPEMKTLSRQWLAALKDHALLSLPSGSH